MRKQGRTKKPPRSKSIKEVFEKRIYCSFRYNASTKKRKFKLSLTQVLNLIYQNCFYCDSPPSNKMRRIGRKCEGYILYYSGLDRKNNDKGYTKDNVVPCCQRCNAIKSNLFTFEEMVALAVFLRDQLPQLTRPLLDREIEAQRATTLRQKIRTARKSS
jgi:hypothetical protein